MNLSVHSDLTQQLLMLWKVRNTTAKTFKKKAGASGKRLKSFSTVFFLYFDSENLILEDFLK